MARRKQQQSKRKRNQKRKGDTMKVTIRKSTKNIGLHYVISINGKPVSIAFSKAQAEKDATKLKKRLKR